MSHNQQMHVELLKAVNTQTHSFTQLKLFRKPLGSDHLEDRSADGRISS